MLTAETALRKDRTTSATLEHRHFAFIARTIASLPCGTLLRHDVAKHFAAECARTNPRFDRARFIRASLRGLDQ